MLSSDKLDPDHLIGIWVDEEVRLRDDDGKLNGGAINSNRIPHQSCNKIPESEREDLFIEINNEIGEKKGYFALWFPGQEGLTPSEEEFTILDKRQLYFLSIRSMNFEKEFRKTIDKKEIPFKFKLGVVHRPIKTNYWHFEFEITNLADNTIIQEVRSKGWRKQIDTAIRVEMQKMATF